MSILITGGAGFIASNLIGRLLANGEMVVAVDNLSRGSRENVAAYVNHPGFQLLTADLADLDEYRDLMKRLNVGDAPVTEVWHLAANSDIPAGTLNPDIDHRDTFLTTLNTIKVMEDNGVRSLYFASSSAVYGDRGSQQLTEESGPLLPISNYGAMKLASEAMISAACERFLSRGVIFRFPNVVGPPATHGVIFDFIHKLKNTPDHLSVLGDGSQQKPYLHGKQLVDAMLFIQSKQLSGVQVFNIGPEDEGVTVREIAQAVVRAVCPSARITFGDGQKGWVGDVPRFRYSVRKLRELGWTDSVSSYEAICRAVDEIAAELVSQPL